MSPTDAKPHILGLGVACLDYLFLAPRAAPGEQAVLRDHLIEGGGLAATALVAAARLGASAELWTWVGDDPEGESVLAGLRREGVNVSAAEVISGARTPVSFIHVEEGTGERTIFHAGRLDPPRSSIAALAQRNLPCDVLLMDATWPEASRLVATQARQQELPVVGDLCPVGAHADLASLATAIIVPGSCAERLAPEASWEDRLRSLARTGASFVAVTAGAEGCYYLDPGCELAHQPAFSISVVDTTGAGDVFHGAFAYALGRGWVPARAVEFASAVAALSCRALGGRAAIPSLDEALTFLRSVGSCQWAR